MIHSWKDTKKKQCQFSRADKKEHFRIILETVLNATVLWISSAFGRRRVSKLSKAKVDRSSTSISSDASVVNVSPQSASIYRSIDLSI